ncbi:MAG TPA: hypothetical protein VKU87_00225 [Thermomicrobiaceae bacterium]|nr:hypothetical protein [Thermomicrobiaceae bacterium]
MKYLHRSAKNLADPPASISAIPPLDLPDTTSESMRRNLGLIRVACESFIPAAHLADSDPDNDEGCVWVYLPAPRGEGERDELRFLASALAGRFGLVASVIVEASSVTVVLERRGNR